MAAREASIKLTLNAGSFVSTMGQVTQQNVEAARKSEAAWRNAFKNSQGFALGKAGLGGMKNALRDMGSTIKQGVGTVATLGGGIGIGMMVKNAINYREKLRDIEFQINKNGKATVEWTDLQKGVDSAVDATGQKADELATVMSSVFGSTGDAKFSQASILAVGHAATASGKSVDSLGNAAQLLQRKFGATADTLPEMLAVFLQKTDAGGKGLDELTGRFGLMAGEAAEAGFTGASGLSQLLGMIEQLDSRIGEKADPALKMIFQTLKHGSTQMKALEKASGIKFTADTSGMDKIRELLKTKKGIAALQLTMTGDARSALDELIKPFMEAQEAAIGSGEKTKAATDAGIAAFDASLKQMGNRTLSWSKVLEESKKGLKEDPAQKLTLAIEKMQRAFLQPEMMEAIDSLSDELPGFARGVSGALDFVVNRPKTAVAVVVGGKLAMGALGGIGEKLGEGLSNQMSKGAEKLGGMFMSHVAASGGWAKAAGQFGLIAGAALLATEFGKAMIDASMSEDEKKNRDLEGAAATAESMVKHGVGTAEERKAAAEELRAKITAMEKDGGPGIATKLFGSAANLIDPTVEHPMNAFNKKLDEARSALAELERAPEGATKASDRLARSAERAAAALDRLQLPPGTEAPPGSPSGTSKGPPRPANGGNMPGHAI